MDRKSFEKYELSEIKEKELWNDSIIIFDTSALIDFYYYPKETRQEIFDKIFSELKNRLWIPYHVQFEYLKNRKGIIEKPIFENYNPLKDEKINRIITAKSTILKTSEQIKKDTFKSEKHPFLPQDKIDEFIEFTKVIDQKVQQFEKDLKKEIEKQEAEIKSLKDNDTILRAFENHIEVGSELSHSEIMQIVKEGKLRYEFEIPPGYKDLKDKIGTQIFGDLIVWKQILTHAKDEGKSVIFICNDLKIDWCYKDSRNRIESPREELIKEFNDNNQKEFWMYNQSQFLYKAKEFLGVDIADAKIEGISNVIRNSNELIFKCGSCSQINTISKEYLSLEFDWILDSKQSLEGENHFMAEKKLECSFCNTEMKLTLMTFEYPDGRHSQNVYIDNGEIVKNPIYKLS